MDDKIRKLLVELTEKELVLLRDRVKYFNDKAKRQQLNWAYTQVTEEIGEILYGKLSSDRYDVYYSIPEVKASFDEMVDLEREYLALLNQEEEDKCSQPRPAAREDVVDSFNVKGDIIITDPCYIKDFISPTHSRDTIYGDWGCSVWSFDPTVEKLPKEGKKPFGKFCADGARVCVTVLNEAARKKIEEWLTGREWCATIIDNFDGKIEYVEIVGYYAFNGEWDEERSLRIRGTGTKDGKPYGFITSQTSL